MRSNENRSADILARLVELSERLAVVERLRSKRGYCTKKNAAEYIGVSRETLRKLELRGEGPVMNPDGTYSYDNLDIYKETRSAA